MLGLFHGVANSSLISSGKFQIGFQYHFQFLFLVFIILNIVILSFQWEISHGISVGLFHGSCVCFIWLTSVKWVSLLVSNLQFLVGFLEDFLLGILFVSCCDQFLSSFQWIIPLRVLRDVLIVTELNVRGTKVLDCDIRRYY